MYKRTCIHCFGILLLLSVTLWAQNGVSANATRPSASDNAYLTAKGYAELEVGGLLMDNFLSIPALLKYAPSQKLELGFAMSGIVNRVSFGGQSNTDVGDPGLQVKAQLASEPWGALAVAGRVDFVSEVDPTYSAYGVMSYLTPDLQFDATLGFSSFDAGDGSDQSLNYALAVAPRTSGQVGGFVEIFGQSAPDYSPMAFDFGLSFTRTSRLIFDTALAIGLNNDAPDWTLQFGLTATLLAVSP